MTSGVRRAAVLGSPIAHSLSPTLHRAAYDVLGLPWTYDALDCDSQQLPALLAGLDEQWVAVSLTMPLKLAVLPLLDEMSPVAQTLQAVNTVLLTGGRRHGHNTDVTGVRAALVELGTPSPRHPVVLGAGGAARAVLAALAAGGADAVSVVARDLRRAAALRELGDRLGLSVDLVPWERARPALVDADLVVTTTPAGATDELARTPWPTELPLFELLYHPWPTALVQAATAAGAPVVGGLSMLVAQAAEQFTLYSGLPAPAQAMRSAGERALAART